MPFPLAHRDGFVSFDDPDDFCGDVTRFAILFTANYLAIDLGAFHATDAAACLPRPRVLRWRQLRAPGHYSADHEHPNK